MNLNFKFAIVSDLHIALPQTIWDHPNRFHLVEVSIPALELALEHLGQLDLDFLLLPGDLTQHGERENHQWLSQRLSQLPYPVYVIPGNHDLPALESSKNSIGFQEFPQYYRDFGYQKNQGLDYTQEILPGLQLIGLNSNHFDDQGNQIGCLEEQQLEWLEQVLSQVKNQLIFVMIHHNVIEHLPGQATNPLGRRYMLENAPRFLQILKQAGVQLVFTGHLHVQDIAQWQGIYDITTGSLVSYPHPYRVICVHTNTQGKPVLKIESHRITAVEDWPDLPLKSREWMAERSFPFMMKLLTNPPLKLTPQEAEQLVPHLRYFWADIANGDTQFNFEVFPPSVRRYFEEFSATNQIDNFAQLVLSCGSS